MEGKRIHTKSVDGGAMPNHLRNRDGVILHPREGEPGWFVVRLDDMKYDILLHELEVRHCNTESKQMTKWDIIRDGYGLQEVPQELVKEIGCAICSPEFKNRKLWTTESLHYDGTVRDYQKMTDRLIGNCYCKHHAIWMYEDKE